MTTTLTAATDEATLLKPGLIDVIKHRWIYLFISLAFLVPGIYFIIANMISSPDHAPISLGIDFTGGTILEYGFEGVVTQEDLPKIRTAFDNKGYTGSVIQIQKDQGAIQAAYSQKPVRIGVGAAAKPSPAERSPSDKSATESKSASGFENLKTIVSVRTKQMKPGDATLIDADIVKALGPMTLLQKNAVGPTLAQELFQNGLMALLLAYVLIVGYLTYRFQFDYAVCAIIALVHDTIFLFGVFAMMGYFFHTEVDSLFVTAILTVVGFSVHDTIVVFDRLRENSRILYRKKLPFGVIANISVNQTLARSINTSLTALLTLISLYLLGGETTRDFVFAMIIGIAVGTFSSIFIASLLLAWWRESQGIGADAPSAG
ncbi:MAG: protein translocase subunit SecF [Cyanobacteria bacterium]|nr:protein translocase subunit SecF [Cyanobacteriota bacterium]